jgi:hypothetical protein
MSEGSKTYTSIRGFQAPGKGYTKKGTKTLIGNALIIFDGRMMASGIAMAISIASVIVTDSASTRSSINPQTLDFFGAGS